MPKIVQEEPPATLRPFLFHGMPLDWAGKEEADCDCPSCGRGDRKFSVNVSTGEFKCMVCDFRGGHHRFLQWLWKESDRQTNGESQQLADDRGLLYRETLTYWGCCVSAISRAWLVPAYNADGALTQLYKRIRTPERWDLRPTPDVGGHAMHGVPLLDKKCDTIFLTEGPWDAMVLWEMLKHSKRTERGLEFTTNQEASLLASASVLAVPNCGAVGEPLRRFLDLFRGKRVILCFDNDHPREHEGRVIDGAGHAATKRAAGMLVDVARELLCVRWGPDGYNGSYGDGWDVRDVILRVGVGCLNGQS